MNNSNGGKQRDATRQELFITLNYLLANCYDKDHTSKTVELTEYAYKAYGVFLDRRRANEILNFLSSCSVDFPSVLPFSVVKVKDKPRYYIERDLFEKDATKKIAESIFSNSSLSKNYSRKLLDLFLSRTCNKNDKTKIFEKLDKKERLVKRKSEATSKWILSYERLRDEQLRFSFKPLRYVSLDACSDTNVWRFLNDLKRQPHEDDQYCGGLVYEVINQGKNTDVCIFLPDIMGAVILNIDKILVPENSRFSPQWNVVTYGIRSDKYASIDEMMDAYYKGKAGLQIEIKFKFNVGTRDNIDDSLIKKRAKYYYDYFGKTMEYTLEDREIVITRDPDQEPERIQAVDLHSSVTCNYQSFRNWYWEYGLYENLVVLSPAIINNRLLSAITARFQRRLEKYGQQPPTEEELQAMRERREQRGRERGARSANNN